MPQYDPSRLVRGTYSIYHYTDQIYKIVKFKCTEISTEKPDRSQYKHTGKKLDPSFSRARKVVLEKGLCNPWDYFASLTIDPKKYDRFNLKTFYKDFSQFLRDYRKKGYLVRYLLVPELHKDGAWHLHGFFHGLPELVSFYSMRQSGSKVPDYLVAHDFLNWPEYQSKFGFCSFGRINSPVRSAFYISKYITKDTNNLVSGVGSKLYYCSQGLNRATLHEEIYGPSSYLDDFLQQEYEFCSVGMTKVSNNLNWSFAMDLDGSTSYLEQFTPLWVVPSSGNFMEDMSQIQMEQLTYF